jgi:hypothetical protein
VTAVIGVNGKYDHSLSPALCAAWQARVIRFPLDARYDARPYIEALVKADLIPLPVFASGDAFTIDGQWVKSVEIWAHEIGDLVDVIQGPNESDGPETEEGASWRMSQEETNTWIGEFRKWFPRDRQLLIGPGLVSGNAAWVRGLDLGKLDALAVHPYAKEPGSARRRLGRQHPRNAPAGQRFVPGDAPRRVASGKPLGVPVGPMLAEYAAFGLPLWITEYHSGTRGMAGYLRDHPAVDAALAFCGHQYAEFGLVDHPAALADFLSVTGGSVEPLPQPEPEPVPGQYEYILGFRDIWLSNPTLVGQPRQNEAYPVAGFTSQLTTNGLLIWDDRKGHFFFDTHDGARYLWRGDRLERVA